MAAAVETFDYGGVPTVFVTLQTAVEDFIIGFMDVVFCHIVSVNRTLSQQTC